MRLSLGKTWSEWRAIPAGLILLIGGASALAGLPPEPAPLPTSPLRPPLPPVPPSFWETYSVWIITGLVLLLVAAGYAGWKLTRPAPRVPMTPVDRARKTLLPLAGQPETGSNLVTISRALRKYFIREFELEAQELTSQDFASAVTRHPVVPPGTAQSLVDLLRACDERKFAPAAPAAPLDAANRALRLVEEGHLAKVASQAPPDGSQQATSK